MSDEKRNPDADIFKIPDSDTVVDVSINGSSLSLLLLMLVPAMASISGDFTEAIISGHTLRRFMDAKPGLMDKFLVDMEKLAEASCEASGLGDKYREAVNAQR